MGSVDSCIQGTGLVDLGGDLRQGAQKVEGTGRDSLPELPDQEDTLVLHSFAADNLAGTVVGLLDKFGW